MMNNVTAIIILNYKNYKETIKCISSILKSTSNNFTIFVIDNASNNNSLEEIETFFGDSVIVRYHESLSRDDLSQIVLIQASENKGYAAGNNIGLRIAYNFGFNYLLVLNNDTIFVDNCLNQLIGTINSDNSILCVGPLLLKPDGSYDYNCAKRRPRLIDFFILSYFGRWLKTKKWENRYYYIKTKDKIQTVLDVDIISGSCMLFRSELFKKIDFFDEGTFLYYEEAIIHEKARKANFRILINTFAEVIHLGAQSTKQLGKSDFTLKCEYRSSIYYLTKYRGLSKLEAKIVCFPQYLFILLYQLKLRIRY
ncbi:glycosyltransferase family 2 protein [Leadbetterella byssophila]|uniref:glycosyltransferase family 2 protein n=1 Tax=Leadbetterella byssophila TaxID=316068 RepID=UPI00399FA26B